MTHGPWRVGDAGMTVFGPPQGLPPLVVARTQNRDNAKAIAALPELIEAARRASDILSQAFAGDPTARELRRILARIDGEDA